MNLKRPQCDGWRCARHRAPTGAQLRARLLQDFTWLPQALRQPRIQRIMKKPRRQARLLLSSIAFIESDAPQIIHEVKGIEMLRPKTFARGSEKRFRCVRSLARGAGERFPCVQSLARGSEKRFPCVQSLARRSEKRFRYA